MMRPLEAVKAALQAYVDDDRAAIEGLIAEDYSFTSPLDNALDREAYFAICWPNSVSMTGVDVMQGAENGEYAWIVYEGTAGGKRFRNAELHRVVGGKIVSTEVYFGWDMPHPTGAGEHSDPESAAGKTEEPEDEP